MTQNNSTATKKLSYLEVLEDAISKQSQLSLELVKLQGEQMVLISKKAFVVGKKQKKVLSKDIKANNKHLRCVEKALKQICTVIRKMTGLA